MQPEYFVVMLSGKTAPPKNEATVKVRALMQNYTEGWQWGRNSHTGDLSNMIFAGGRNTQARAIAWTKPRYSKQRVRVHADFWRRRIQGLQLKSHLLNLAE